VNSGFCLLLLVLSLASNKSGGSGEREEGENPNARTQLSTRPSTRPHQSAPPHHKTRTTNKENKKLVFALLYSYFC